MNSIQIYLSTITPVCLSGSAHSSRKRQARSIAPLKEGVGAGSPSVLPDPVLATPMTSLPDMMTGSACLWMEKGAAYPRASSSRSTGSGRPVWSHVKMGRGAFLPL